MSKNTNYLELILSRTDKKRGNFLKRYINYAADLGRDAVLLHSPGFTEDFAVNGSMALGIFEGVAYWLGVSAVTNSIVGTLFGAILIPAISYLRGLQATYSIRKFRRIEIGAENTPKLNSYEKPVGLFDRYGS